MSGRQRGNLHDLSMTALHYALGARIAISVGDLEDGLRQTDKANYATERLMKALSDQASEGVKGKSSKRSQEITKEEAA